jgi:hypothetical protein
MVLALTRDGMAMRDRGQRGARGMVVVEIGDQSMLALVIGAVAAGGLALAAGIVVLPGAGGR